MRLTQKKIEEILATIVGEEGLPLIRELLARDNVSEFDLATKTKKDIKVVRRMLYQLYNYNLVGFTRKKDKDKGWYIYYWTLLTENIRFNYFKSKREQLEKLQQRLEGETKELFFVCPSRCVRLNFDQSIGFDFRCPECGELASQDNSEPRIKELKRRIQELVAELKEDQISKKAVPRKTVTKKAVKNAKNVKIKLKKDIKKKRKRR